MLVNNYLVPNVIERTADGERAYDLESRLLTDRIILINSDVNEMMSRIVIAELLYLNSIDSSAPIHMYIMSPGGDVHAGIGIIDIMESIDAPVYTYCTGFAASMGAAIFSAGEKGHRYVMKHSNIMLHQVASGCQGKLHDMSVDVNYTRRLNNVLLGLIAKNSGKITDEEYEVIYDTASAMVDDDERSIFKLPKELEKKFDAFKKSIDRDTWLMPKQAIEFGIADEIINKRKIENM